MEITLVSSGYYQYISLSDYLHSMGPVKAESYPNNGQYVWGYCTKIKHK